MNGRRPGSGWGAGSPGGRWGGGAGAATFPPQMSKPAMNIASSTTGSISHRRGSGPSRRACADLGWDTVSVTFTPQQWKVPVEASVFEGHRSSMHIELYDRRPTHRHVDLCWRR